MLCEAGVILQNLNDYLEQFRLVTPYNLGAKGSCTLGGNASTLAGGINFVYFGSLRNYIQGLKVVTGKGELLDLVRWTPKDNTGIDLKQLFIGSEGQLGIITEVALMAQPLKPFSETCFLRVKGFPAVLDFLHKSKTRFGSMLYSVEYLDYESYKVVLDNLGLPMVLSPDARFESMTDYQGQCYRDHKLVDDQIRDYFLLIEIVGDNQEELAEALYNFIEENEECMSDGMICEGESQRRTVWEIRESVVMSIKTIGGCLKYDISLNPKRFQDLVDHVRETLGSRQKFISGYGHIGDGNLHLNVCVSDELMESTQEGINPQIRNTMCPRSSSMKWIKSCTSLFRMSRGRFRPNMASGNSRDLSWGTNGRKQKDKLVEI